jgi:hypothetical protein
VSASVIARLDRASAVTAAAGNNAEWCDAVCRSHGLPGTFSHDAWTNPRRTPPLYPDAVTLRAAASAPAVLAAIDTATPGATVKDSFARLDLSADGFDVLFEAEWLYREASPRPRDVEEWQQIRDPGALERWESAWAGAQGPRGLFRSELLDEPNVVVLSLERDGRIAAGAILSRSKAVVGVSNLFSLAGELAAAWPGCLAGAAQVWPGASVVGYEAGHELDAAHAAGFVSTGLLQVWSAAS